MHFVPRPYQHLIRNHILDHERSNVWAGMGMGKSGASLDSFDTLRMLGEAKRLLVIGPKRVAKNTWPREVAKWNKSFGHLTVAAMVGTEDERVSAARSGADICTINYDNLPWLVARAGAQWPWDMVVADECFVAGTLVSTPSGTTPIEQLSVGDEVMTSFGARKVSHVFKKQTRKPLVEVRLVNGTRIVCTPNHRFWTEDGWQNADELGHATVLHTPLSPLRGTFCDLAVQDQGAQQGPFLPSWLLDIGSTIPNQPGSIAGQGGESDQVHRRQRDLVEQRGCDARIDTHQVERDTRGARLSAPGKTRRERSGYDGFGESADTGVSTRMDLEPPDTHEAITPERVGVQLQTGFRMAGEDALPRGGRAHPWQHGGKVPRCEEDARLGTVRVDRVATVEHSGVCDVWDIEVEGAHQYYAGGVLVHNCTRLKGLRVSLQKSKLGKEFLTGQGSVRAKALASVAHRYVNRWVNLTGSPAPNGVKDLWGSQFFVDKGFRLGNSFTAFSDRFFRPAPGSDGYSDLIPLPYAQAQIEALLRDCTISVDAKDWFDIKEPIERIVRIELPPAARKQYQEMQKELFTQVAAGGVNQDVEAFNAGAKSNKCLQIASGNVYYDDKKNWAKVHDEKIEALQSIVEETNGEPLLVRYCYRPELERILKAFPRAKFFDDKMSTEEDWNKGRYPMLVTHAASAGHGSNLQDGGRILVDYSQGWDLEQDEQIIERIGPTRQLQSGHDRSVFRYRIVAGDTIEETAVLPRIKMKMSVQDALKAAMK